MGWDYYAATRAELVADLTRSTERADCIAHARGKRGALWSVWAIKAGEYAGRRIVSLDLIGKCGGRWGHKSMAEDSGPYYWDCPVRFLDLATGEDWGAWARSWRERVIAYHAGGEEAVLRMVAADEAAERMARVGA